MHHRHGVPIHPHYLRGHERVGCWPCINSRKESVRLIAQDDPSRIDEIDRYESEFTAERARRNQSGEGSFEYPQATFFMPVTPGVPNGIRDVVAWSRTSRGGVQLKLLQDDPDSGCFRWGLCESPGKEVG